MEGVCQEGSNGRGDQRNMQERLQGARPLSVDLVQMVHRRVQLDAGFHFPADAVQVDHLPRPDLGRKIREEEAIAPKCLDT